MSATLLDAFGGIVTIELTGQLVPDELASIHQEMGTHLRNWSGGKLLILAERFTGWSDDDAWSDVSFQTDHDHLIQGMALVADVRWEQFALLFTAKGLRPFPIEYFATGDEVSARAWLKS
ncbi:STAS/SEC14 domain-containing protein [Luteolibacter luteus]|uniref:STAS/SEC14 domain-containing protein n=1 Tax=Luteolibacter luteus TaxID=2728835 RepID=A0A858RK41_9BACT|nr:STAS/SEC14 domain-containing protein [Luteolibacter luteus]QJE97095.1 STAS/SEC14 domain-containing protein [Luteolibacter luteus]